MNVAIFTDNDFGKVNGVTTRSEELRRQWGVSDGRPAVVYAGRLSREKNLQVFASLEAALQRAGATHRLVFVGDAGGPRENMVDGRTGAECRNPDEMARATMQIVRNPPRRRRLGANARAYAVGRRWDASGRSWTKGLPTRRPARAKSSRGGDQGDGRSRTRGRRG